MKTEARLDRDGRILIPNQLRKAVGFNAGNMLSITADGNKLIVEAVKAKCILCGTEEGLEQIDAFQFCTEHKNKLIKILGGKQK